MMIMRSQNCFSGALYDDLCFVCPTCKFGGYLLIGAHSKNIYEIGQVNSQMGQIHRKLGTLRRLTQEHIRTRENE